MDVDEGACLLTYLISISARLFASVKSADSQLAPPSKGATTYSRETRSTDLSGLCGTAQRRGPRGDRFGQT